MVRKTKKEALETRENILDAAERVFDRHGVSRTSLSAIAAEAGVTRGAIYWHFANKAELFDAMMERAIRPLQDIGEVDYGQVAQPLTELRERHHEVLRHLLAEPRYLRVLSIAWHKCEYVDEMVDTVDQCMEASARHLGRVETALRTAQELGQLSPSIDTHRAAMGLTTLIDGFVGSWSQQPDSLTLDDVDAWIDCYLRGLEAVR